MEKYAGLLENLKKYDKLCIAYSGGVDSTLLLAAAKEAIGDRVFAIVADTALLTRGERQTAEIIAEDLGVECFFTDIDILEIPQIAYNEINRCYHCKKTILSGILKIAYLHGIKTVADGRVVKDSYTYRPGEAAATELGVISPLYECGITKEDVREISKTLGLPSWNKTSNSCLATRFRYDTEISKELLKRVEDAESALSEMGFKSLRVRTHDDLARIEAAEGGMELAAANRERITFLLKGLGFRFVTFDLEPFRSGSMDY